MSFGLSAAGMAAVVVGTTGVGLSAASAAGAFNGPVDNWSPTPQELTAAKWSKATFNLGQDLQKPLDAIARRDISYLGSPEGLTAAAGTGLNNAWRGMGDLTEAPTAISARSGGPGSGQFWGQMWDTKAALGQGLYGADVAGRMGGLNEYIGSTNTYLGRKSRDLSTGLGAMTSGGQQAAQAQADRINAQVAQNVATASAMSGLGNTMIGAGVGMFGAKTK